MWEIIQTSVSVTTFVLLMMLVIEFINVKTKGSWDKPLKKNPFLQVFIATLLGAIPGCLGVYTVVSLFTHKVIGFGALVASMIATSGDEAFMMFALMPQKAMWLSIIIFGIALVSGLILNFFYKNKPSPEDSKYQFHIHKQVDTCICKSKKGILYNLKNISFTRGVILIGLLLFGLNLYIGKDHHNHTFSINQEVFSAPVFIEDNHTHIDEVITSESNHTAELEDEHQHGKHLNLPKIVFLILTLISIYIILIAPEHFIEEHAWNHVIKKHFLKIFLWTFGTLLVIFAIKNYVSMDIASIAKDNIWLVLLIAVLIGIIPESGPHMLFISLFMAGVIPFSILIANSIVQDGHGSLPLFAENKKAFFYMKALNVLIGFAFGGFGILFGL